MKVKTDFMWSSRVEVNMAVFPTVTSPFFSPFLFLPCFPLPVQIDDLFVCPSTSPAVLSCMLVKAYRIHVWGVSGWSTGSGHVLACEKHGAPGGPQTWLRMQRSTDAHNQWCALCSSCHSGSGLKRQHLFQQALVNKLFYMQTNCSFWQEVCLHHDDTTHSE